MIRASKFVSALLLAVAAFVFAGSASAQTGPSGPVAPAVNPTAPQAPTATLGISEAELLNVLRAFDPNFKTAAIKDGVEYRFTIVRDGWQFQVRLSSFHNMIWIDAILGDPSGNIQKVPAEVVAQLMQENFKIGPTHFSLMKGTDGRLQLNLGVSVERALVNADRLRGVIDNFCKNVKDTYPAWSAYLNAAK